MNLTVSEKIKIILGRRDMNITMLAEKINTSRQNLMGKISRDNFSEKEMREIAEALDCDFDTVFTMRDTGETL